jgi:transposase
MRTPMKITLTEEDQAILERWVKSRSVGDKQRLRARLVRMTADGLSTKAIMSTLDVSNPTLNKWRNRYLESGVEGLKKGKTRPSQIPALATEKGQEVLSLTLTGKPVAATHWSCRTMAEQAGISRMAVHGIYPKGTSGGSIS